MTEIGFIGLGAMGAAMAANLRDAGFTVRAWNRSAHPDATVETPREAAAAGLVLTMVSDDEAVRAVTLGGDGVLGGLPAGGVHVVMSTISPAAAEELQNLHQDAGVAYVSAPVMGRPDMAAAAKLAILAAGAPEGRTRAAEAFEAVGSRVLDLGDDAPAANVMKLAANMLLAGNLQIQAEAQALVESYGLERGRLVDILGETFLPAPALLAYARNIAAHTYEPAGFRLDLGLKDVTLAARAAAEREVPMPLAELVQARLQRGVAEGRGHLDWAALGLLTAEDAGLR